MKRQCSNCRFFSAPANAGTGRCLHPERVVEGAPIIVRGSELNCRLGWGRDLWQAQTAEQAVERIEFSANGDAPHMSRRGGEFGAGATRRDGRQPEVAPEGEPPADGGIDLVVHEGPAPQPGLTRAQPATGAPQANDPRERDLIFKARDLARLRAHNRTRSTVAPIPGEGAAVLPEPSDEWEEPVAASAAADDGASDAISPAASATDEGDEFAVRRPAPPTRPVEPTRPTPPPPPATTPEVSEALAQRFAEFNPVPPVPVSEIRTDLLGWGATRQEATDRFDTVPPLDPSFSLPFREKPRSTRLRAGFDAPGETPDRQRVETDAEANLPWEEERPGEWPQRREIAPASIEEPRREFAPAPVTEPIVRPEPRTSRGRVERAERVAFAPVYEPRDDFDDDLDELLAPLPPAANAVPVADEVDWEDDEPFDEEWIAERDDADYLVEFDGVAVADLDEEPLTAWSIFDEIVPDLPRCCRTCRDFRPAEGGERGWCTSAWAFQHRRMVHADELPCAGAIGTWWLPHDEIWLDDLEFDHGQPTPLVDAMLARHAGSHSPLPPRERRRSRR